MDLLDHLCGLHDYGCLHVGDGIDVWWPLFAPKKLYRVEDLKANVCRAPTTGGQYHWVSEFAPKSSQKFLSYVTGTLAPKRLLTS
jgi:hypothetical protein